MTKYRFTPSGGVEVPLEGLQIPRERLYRRDYTRAVLYQHPSGQARLKIVTHRALRASGLEGVQATPSPPGTVNDCKLDCNVSRAKSAILGYALCNQWDYFCTLTISPTWGDRSDLRTYWASLSKFLRRRGAAYLLVPERHKDGRAWHMHGLLAGALDTAAWDAASAPTRRIAARIQGGVPVHDWPAYSKTYGYCDLEPVQSVQGVAAYITKYATKDLSRSVQEVGAHLYYHSRGLAVPETIMSGTLTAPLKADYANDHVRVTWMDGDADTLARVHALLD